MKIAFDLMGGDYSPSEALAAARQAAGESFELVLLATPEFASKAEEIAETVICQGVISMSDRAVRRDSATTIGRGVQLLKEGDADVFVSAGHTGAVMASALIGLKPITHIERPAIPTPIPTRHGPVVLIDAGANIDVKPRHLLDFALMGTVYSREIFKVAEPRVGLLSIGTEPKKGNKLTLESFSLFEQTIGNFVGHVEGNSIFDGVVDVVVCDGFVGNILLKSLEKFGSHLIGETQKYLTAVQSLEPGKVNDVLLGLKKSVDYSAYGGAPLLGVNGNVIICHGVSKQEAFFNAFKLGYELVNSGALEKIKKQIVNFNKLN